MCLPSSVQHLLTGSIVIEQTRVPTTVQSTADPEAGNTAVPALLKPNGRYVLDSVGGEHSGKT
jgi:hypothetical protein